ncbi:FIST C-terminal domain-containing protein [Chitinilyticum litopenaei]|uniref:FIST C-terminal domain-containing protein n=1 Tax=Chitinilyticum litopenaei TaxID=1121276 RepID=UPI000410D543|nr:FIST C-terminal domain-containing protein [Chitinilyticum litopenaei]
MPEADDNKAASAWSGHAAAAKATPDVASQALSHALRKRGQLTAPAGSRVWLLLTPHFRHCVAACLERLARESRSLHLVGCLANGIFSDEDWSLDGPMAVVLIEPPPPAGDRWRLTLAAPNALAGDWAHDGKLRIGGIAGDATGVGPYCLWQGRHISAGRLDLPCRRPRWLQADGFVPDGPRQRVSASDGLLLTGLNGRPALPLLAHWLQDSGSEQRLWQGAMLHEPDHPRQGRWLALLGRDEARQGLLLGGHAPRDAELVWGHQDPALTAARLADGLTQLARLRRPAFALVFASQHGGAFGGTGEDPYWQAVRTALPGVPFAGFYGNGQLLPLARGIQVIDNGMLAVLFD